MGARRALALAVGATLGLAGQAIPAAARDPAPDDYQPYAPSGFFVYDWTGFYAGANLGGAFAEAESTENIFPNNPDLFVGLTYGQSESSVTGGVQAGWQKQWGKLVAGVEVGYTALQFDTTKPSPLFTGLEAALGLPNLERSVKVSDLFLLTGRLGYADGRWLAYFKGGLAVAEVDATYHNLTTGEATSSGGGQAGWTAGLGADYALTPNLILGIEYNYVNFRSDVTPPLTDRGVPTSFSDIVIDMQTLVVRLNYRFNVPGHCCPGPSGPGEPYTR